MRKIRQVAIVIGISAMTIVGCKGNEQTVPVTDKTAEIGNNIEVEESTNE